MSTNVEAVTDFNLEVHYFTSKLKSYSTKHNVVDMNSVNYLLEMIETVNSFLENTHVRQYPENTRMDNIDFAKHNIAMHRGYECKTCKIHIQATKNGIKEHIESKKHVKSIAPVSRLEKNSSITSSTVSLANSVSKMSVASSRVNSPKANRQRDNSVSSVKSDMSNVKAKKKDDDKKKDKVPDQNVSVSNVTKKFLETVNIREFIAEKVKTGEDMIYKESHSRITKDIESRLEEEFPKIRTYCFGSRFVGLGFEDSDLDIFICIDNAYNGTTTHRKQEMASIIHKTKTILMNSGYWDNFEPVVGARTPILRAWNAKEKIDCDLSFSNGLSHCNTQLMKYLFGLQPLCLQIALFVKKWANKPRYDGMNSYMLSLLVIFYFQTKNLLPSVNALQENIPAFTVKRKYGSFDAEWQANFSEKSLSQLNMSASKDLKQHLMGFFDFFGNSFSFSEFVVCPLVGHGIRKVCFDPSVENLPECMVRYVDYMKKIDISKADPVSDLFLYETPMVIQDPFELSHNVARRMRARELARFVVYCKFTAKYLQCKKF